MSSNDDADIDLLICPECAAGKHGNCDSTTWDPDADRRTNCGCWIAKHQS